MASRANLGPLTTTFTPPASCNLAAANALFSSGPRWLAQGCINGMIFDDTDCWPTATITSTTPPFHGFGFYSPGLICPSGYWSACRATGPTTVLSVSNSVTSFVPQFPILADETAIGCCPSGFTCSAVYDQRYQTCLRFLTKGSVDAIDVGTCTTSSSLDSLHVPFGTGTGFPVTDGSGNTFVFAITEALLGAPLVQLVYREADVSLSSFLATTTTTPSTTLSIASSTGSSIAPLTASSTATNNPTPYISNTSSTAVTTIINQSIPDAGLPSSVIFGVSIGFPLGVSLLTVAAAYVFITRRRARLHVRSKQSSTTLIEEGTNDTQIQYPPTEMCAAQTIHLLPDSQKPTELHGTSS